MQILKGLYHSYICPKALVVFRSSNFLKLISTTIDASRKPFSVSLSGSPISFQHSNQVIHLIRGSIQVQTVNFQTFKFLATPLHHLFPHFKTNQTTNFTITQRNQYSNFRSMFNSLLSQRT